VIIPKIVFYARGKRLYDKRESLKGKADRREIERGMRGKGRDR
jgi:tmRNA-binding protein